MSTTKTAKPEHDTAIRHESVPAGVLLEWRRVSHGLSIDDVSVACGIDAGLVSEVETGAASGDDGEALAQLIDFHARSGQADTLATSRVIVDLEGGTVAMQRAGRGQAGHTSDADRTFLQYLDMLTDYRDLEIGVRIPFQEVDLILLRRTLAERREAVVDYVEQLHEVDESDAETSATRSRVLATLAAAGFVVGGTVVALTTLTNTETPAPADYTPAVVTESPIAVTGDAELEIGTAVVVEREAIERVAESD